MTQMALDGTGVPTPPDVKLTKRQRFALELIGRLGYVSSEQLGSALHEYRSAHRATTACTFCRPEGAAMGASLREKGLVRLKRAKGWYVVGEKPPAVPVPAGAYDPSTAPIPY